jgi:hypothetical protein
MGVGFGVIENHIWKTNIMGKFVGPINKVIFCPLFALNIEPGSTLDTPWFFVPLMIPILFFWAWLLVWLRERLKK